MHSESKDDVKRGTKRGMKRMGINCNNLDTLDTVVSTSSFPSQWSTKLSSETLGLFTLGEGRLIKCP